MLVEVGNADEVVSELMTGFANKQPKIVAASLGAIARIVNEFGVKGISCKPVLQKVCNAIHNLYIIFERHIHIHTSARLL